MKYIISFLIAIVMISCDNQSSHNYNNNDYYKTKNTLEDQETANPKHFLEIDGTWTKNLMGEYVIKGRITNSAKIATYKDVKVKISFYSKTGSLMKTEYATVYDYFKSGTSKSYKIKTLGVKRAKEIKWEIEGASPSY